MNPSTPTLALASLDSIEVDLAHHRVVFENDQVRVLRWVLGPHDKTLHHSHPNNLSIALTDYNGKVTGSDGTVSEVHTKAGSVVWRPAGVHEVENLTNRTMEGVIVEPKKPSSERPANAPDPVAVDPEHHTVEFENDQIRVLREHRNPGNLVMHGHPDSVQVLLTDLNAILTTPDGKTQTISGSTGDVRWRPATQHAGRILGQKPVEQILVEMKVTPVLGLILQ